MPEALPRILVHAGAGSDPGLAPATEQAAHIAREALATGGSPLEAACHATAHLEDDGRFNAGVGSNVRADGRTVEMDAACMAGDGRFGAVACIQRVRHPVFAARHVLDTEHLVLAGDGAQQFARAAGMPDFDPAQAKAQADREAGSASDTVGCVVLAEEGAAAALSSGGTREAPRGRVGDVPLPGAGLRAGPAGAVAATGHGETIAERLTALRAYERLEAGQDPQTVVDEATGAFPEDAALGLIAVTEAGGAAAANRPMAWTDLAPDA